MPEPTFPRNAALNIQCAANGFIVELAPDPRRDSNIVRTRDVLVFNHLGAGLLAFLGQHFESDEDRAAREARAADSALNKPSAAPDPIPQPLAGAYLCAMDQAGRGPCQKFCGANSCLR